MKPTTLWAALVLAIASPAARAAIVHTVSARPLEGKLAGISADGDLEIVVGGKKSLVPLAKVYRIEVQARAPQRDPSSTVEVQTIHGTRIWGRLARPRQALAILSPPLGRSAVQFDAEALLAVRFVREEGKELNAERFARELARLDKESDTLFVASPKGVVPFAVAVEQVGPGSVSFSWRGEDRTLDTAKVAAVFFANSPAPAEPQASVLLSDASVLCGTLASLKRGVLELDLAGTKVSVPLANVISVELANPDLVYLSALRPAQVKETPFFNHVWAHRSDQSIGGNPLTLDGTEYARGIGCHTRTELAYDVGGRYKQFAAVIGIDDEARPRGSVRFIVRADDKDLLDRKLTGRDKAVSVTLPIAGVKRLTLLAEFAEDASVGDHADWADARIMK